MYETIILILIVVIIYNIYRHNTIVSKLKKEIKHAVDSGNDLASNLRKQIKGYHSDLAAEMNRRIDEKEKLEDQIHPLKEEIIRLEECIKIKNKSIFDSAEFRKTLDQENIALRKINTELESTMESTVKEAVLKARKDSIKRQRSILKGQATEHLAPYINSDYNPKDYRFFGDPVDFIIFDGMHNFKETKSINKVIFMDIKTGTSNLTTLQRRIRDAINDGNVEFQIYNPEKDIDNNKE